ncbi:MAG: hypothetical protein GF310_10130 [candidate division Zixibacteria bacterium]|nr:hypothetical protein [candidate division Zixibacteria bacterium]
MLQQQILQDKAVRNVLDTQQKDGWLLKGIHGYDSHEGAIRMLLEKESILKIGCLIKP